jgi:hypothetical protein
VARRPYRIVFTRPASGIDGPVKPGTIVKADLGAAQDEARAIARSGGTAEVHYVADSGRREVIATYRPDSPVQRVVETAIRFGPHALLVLTAAEWLIGRWRRERG